MHPQNKRTGRIFLKFILRTLKSKAPVEKLLKFKATLSGVLFPSFKYRSEIS